MIALGLETGLRVSAIVNIDVEDIDMTANTIKVIEKGKKTRYIGFGDNLKALLEKWLIDRSVYYTDQETGPLFISQCKNRLAVRSVRDLVEKYTSHLDKHITPHKLRSSAAMNLHGAGTDIVTIASVLGHNNIATTQRYVSAYEENKRAAVHTLDNLIAIPQDNKRANRESRTTKKKQ